MKRSDFIKLMSSTPALLAMKNLNDLEKFSDHLNWSEKIPALFIGHGSPMNAIEDNEFVKGFKSLSQSIQKPKAIICISAHWFTKGTKVTAMETPPTIHDFGGFPQALFDIQYPANGNPVLAKETQTLLMPTPVELDEKWGLDHGTWTVLRHFYPKSDVPVIQLSIDYSKPAAYHFELATRLAILRHKGILIMGSGNIIHNLRLVDFANINKDNYGYDWAIEARETLNNLIINGDFKSLMNYEKLGRAVQLAIPTPDHYLPLIYALGLKSKDDKVSFVNDKLLGGSLSMTSLKIDVS